MSEVIAIIIFLGVILAIMTEKIHRTAAALTGTVLLLLTHVLTVDKAVGYIDFNTIGSFDRDDDFCCGRKKFGHFRVYCN